MSLAAFPEGVTVVAKGTPIFPRLDMEEEIAYIKEQMEVNKPAVETEWNPDEVELKLNKEEIKFEDFDKVEIRVAEVKEVSKVEGSDKLLQFRLDAGDGRRPSNPLRNCKILSKRTRIGRQESSNRC